MPKISEAVEEYLKVQRHRRGEYDGTLSNHLNILNMFVRMTGDKQLSSLTADHLEAFFYGPGGIRDDHWIWSSGSRRLGPPVSERTHNHYRQRLSTFFDWCTRKGYLKRDVMIHTKHLKVHKKTRQRPAPATLLRLLDVAANPRDRAFIATAINTALRASELEAIKVGHVDLDAQYIEVTIRKTGDVDDQPISRDLGNELRRWLTTYQAEIGRPLTADDALFPSRTGGLISHYETMPDGARLPVRSPTTWTPASPIKNSHLIAKRALAALGIDGKGEGVHTIRRAVALAYYHHACQEQGDVAALRETSALLHHANVATTEIYLGMTPEKNRRDKRIKGRPFLTEMIDPQENVVRLPTPSDPRPNQSAQALSMTNQTSA